MTNLNIPNILNNFNGDEFKNIEPNDSLNLIAYKIVNNFIWLKNNWNQQITDDVNAEIIKYFAENDTLEQLIEDIINDAAKMDELVTALATDIQNNTTLQKLLKGERGSQIFFGTSDPSSVGSGFINSDIYFNSTSNDLFQYNNNGSWTKIGNLKGDSGTYIAGDNISINEGVISSDKTNLYYANSEPASKPTKIGDIYINTKNGFKFYFAILNGSNLEWKNLGDLTLKSDYTTLKSVFVTLDTTVTNLSNLTKWKEILCDKVESTTKWQFTLPEGYTIGYFEIVDPSETYYTSIIPIKNNVTGYWNTDWDYFLIDTNNDNIIEFNTHYNGNPSSVKLFVRP